MHKAVHLSSTYDRVSAQEPYRLIRGISSKVPPPPDLHSHEYVLSSG